MAISIKNKLGLTSKILIGMGTGIVLGLILRNAFPESDIVKDYITEGFLHVIGTIFISSLKMLVVPLVFISLVCGTCSLSEPSKLGRLGGKTLAFYLFTTAIALVVAIVSAVLIHPGNASLASEKMEYIAKEAPSLSSVIINIVPTNPMQALSEGNMLQIIIFAVIFGFAIAHIGERGKRVAALFEDLNEVIMRVVTLIMQLAPYGVFALMAKLALTLGLETFGSVVKYFFVVLGVLLVHAFIVYPALLKLFSGLNPFIFIRKMRDVQLFAFSTASSNATLPITIEASEHRLGVDNKIAAFTLPLGATINMDGTAIMQGVATVFIAQVFGIELSLTDYAAVVVTATLASIGTAGVPGVGLIMLAMVLNQVGLPVEGIALIIGVDRLLDMVRTAVNVTGDCVATVIIAKSEGEFNEQVFNNTQAGKAARSFDEQVHHSDKSN
ncbi:MAG: dicarboxylate/amino acid:cation symporter [Gammaproteobacteria bacterium]|nr:dicarboxylate/amino acid:cation symporter [uncultured Shewanella sp.]MBU1394307.1 dicarboxylate/amino acid:cation symporter [Gammaproteobacteria bacterium]QYX63074.1 dicarboxylate/amino acid:cation symporter [Shewanella putrefaciens]MBU1478505.1 dicarboxylate/amino acid:cation symporter [Gammaproteobacteria bacterium]MBU2001378.1 dicarboxylate/amino acid:cation symporter [Gammaproteobacteria bacterium]MBU2134418.1 dicarboxylate/amino acid:cation symporter [Gammaproteobacteria bacterium]